MFQWLADNFSTIIICALLITLVVFVIKGLVNDRKKGISSCGCSCSSCPMGGKCHESK